MVLIGLSIVNDINGTHLILSIPFVNRNTYDIHYVHPNIPYMSSDVIVQDLYNTKVVPCEIEVLMKRKLTHCSYSSHGSKEYTFESQHDDNYFRFSRLSLDYHSNNTLSKAIPNSEILAVPSTCAIQSNDIHYIPLEMPSIDLLPLHLQPTTLNYTISRNVSELVRTLSSQQLGKELN